MSTLNLVAIQTAVAAALAKTAGQAAEGLAARFALLLASALAKPGHTWAFLAIAARAADMAARAGEFPSPELIKRYLEASASEFFSEQFGREWLKLKPLWKDPPTVV